MTIAIADWKDVNAYPRWGRPSLMRFAWEFLRRNPEYQKDWENYVHICRSIVPNYDPLSYLDYRDRHKLEHHPDYHHFDPPRMAGETAEEWDVRVSGENCNVVSFSIWYAQKWGLRAGIRNPFYVKWIPAFSNTPSPHIISKIEDGERYKDETYRVLVFDLSIPVDIQIESARRMLLERQQILIERNIVKPFKNKIPRKEWVIYLRLLDAEADQVSPKEMAAELYPHEDDVYPDYLPQKKVRTALTKARKWRDSWYQLIPLLQPPRRKKQPA